MSFIVSFIGDKYLFLGSENNCQAILITTEYRHKNDILVHLNQEKTSNINLNNLLSYQFKKDIAISKEHFFLKKSYSENKLKKITRNTFEEKISRFNTQNTVTEQEILIEYAYENKVGQHEKIQITVCLSGEIMTAAIDFKDAGQYDNFISPSWLKESKNGDIK